MNISNFPCFEVFLKKNQKPLSFKAWLSFALTFLYFNICSTSKKFIKGNDFEIPYKIIGPKESHAAPEPLIICCSKSLGYLNNDFHISLCKVQLDLFLQYLFMKASISLPVR